MKKLSGLVEFVSGTPQFRITESVDNHAPCYKIYSQDNLMDDLTGIDFENSDNKIVRTKDEVNTLVAGDLLFSLINGKAVIVRNNHTGYLYTQNYIKLLPCDKLDSLFLAYMLNESKMIRKQLFIGLQGSTVLKYTLQQLRELQFDKLPELEKQQIIGQIYFKQLRLKALRRRVAESEEIINLAKLEKAVKQ